MKSNATRQRIEAFLPFAVLAVLFLLAFNTLVPFLPAILWGVILSVALAPSHDRLARRLGHRRRAATWIIGLLLVLVLFLPMVGISRAFLSFMPVALDWLQTTAEQVDDDIAGLPAALSPMAGETLWLTLQRDLHLIKEYFGEEIRPLLFWMLSEIKILGTFLIEFALGILLALVLLHRSDELASLVRRLMHRIGGDYALEMIGHAAATTRSAVLGLLGAAGAQTIVAAFAYFIAGVPHWGLFAGLTFLLATVQVGPVLVWLPIAVWLWVNDQIAMAIFMTVWGLFAVGLTDNLVRTVVVSRGSRLPALLALLGAIGGLLTWGIVGVFLGPVIVAVCHQLTIRWLETEAEETTEDALEPAASTAPDDRPE